VTLSGTNATNRIELYVNTDDNLDLMNTKKIIFTENAPAPIGPYNQAVLIGNTLYTSGQIALDPVSMELVMDDIETETRQVMENMKAVLDAAGMTFDHVVKTTIFLMNMGDFARINAVYGSYFDEKTAPARETVQVACLPKNVNVEISMVAVNG
jgi:2-iminobutanoate/2-iminopropanoate deaminase